MATADDNKRSAFTEVQKEAIGIALSEVRFQLQQEIVELASRLAKLEERIGLFDEDDYDRN
jgi:hypothetical protein